MAKKIEDFRDLKVYQEARAAAKEIFELTRNFPPDEKFALITQMKNSSRSVCGSIAEG